MRKHVFAKFADNVSRRLLEALQERLIGLQNAEIGVVHEDQILNGVEGVRPLPMRTQNLFEQPQVFGSDADRLADGFEEVQFFASVVRLPEHPSDHDADHCPLALHRHHYNVMNILLLDAVPARARAFRRV